MDKIKVLKEAGLILPEAKLSASDQKKIVELLSDDEIDALVSIRAKLGDDFLQRNAMKARSIGIVF